MTTLVKSELAKHEWQGAENLVSETLNSMNGIFLFSLSKSSGKAFIANDQWYIVPKNGNGSRNGKNQPNLEFGEELKAGDKFKSNGIIIVDTKKFNAKGTPADQKKFGDGSIVEAIQKMGTGKKIYLEGTMVGNGYKNLGTIAIQTNIILRTAEFGGAGGGTGPSLAQQEAVTLKIFQILLESNGYLPSTDDDEALGEFRGFCNELGKIWKGLKIKSKNKAPNGRNNDPLYWKTEAEEGTTDGPKEWFWSFFLQFKYVRDITNLPNSKFNFFIYGDDAPSFMEFITKQIVLAGPPRGAAGRSQPWNLAQQDSWGSLSQKDSWNPADIWLVNDSHTHYPATKKALKDAKTIVQINHILINAWLGNHPNTPPNGGATKAVKNPIIAGISLKKNRATSSGWPGRKKGTSSKNAIEYDLVNLTFKGDVLPQVTYDTTTIQLGWDPKKFSVGGTNYGGFRKVTNEMIVNEESSPGHPGGAIGQMKIGSGGFEQPHNINLEFKQKGAGALLGKIPRDLLQDRISKYGNYKLPTHTEIERSIPSKDDTTGEWNRKIDRWEQRCKAVKAKVGTKGGEGKIFELGTDIGDADIFHTNKFKADKGMASVNPSGGFNFIYDIMKAKSSPGWDKKTKLRMNVIMGAEIMEWYYILAKIYDKGRAGGNIKTKREAFDDFIEDTYYMAQKRGSKIKKFGPFGKLH